MMFSYPVSKSRMAISVPKVVVTESPGCAKKETRCDRSGQDEDRVRTGNRNADEFTLLFGQDQRTAARNGTFAAYPSIGDASGVLTMSEVLSALWHAQTILLSSLSHFQIAPKVPTPSCSPVRRKSLHSTPFDCVNMKEPIQDELSGVCCRIKSVTPDTASADGIESGRLGAAASSQLEYSRG